MPFLRSDLALWLAKAEECRQVAEATKKPAEKAALLDVADGYDQLARRAEAAIKAGIRPRDWIVGA